VGTQQGSKVQLKKGLKMKTIFSFLICVVFISNTYALPQCEGDDETKWQNCEGTLVSGSGR